MNILIVDDEPQFRLLLRSFLTSEDRVVLLAENGEEALEKMEGVGMDLIISDVYMPVMDGIKLHRIIREIPGYEEVPFLFVSGFDDQYTLGAIRNPRIDGFYKKGRSMEELKEWVSYLTDPIEKRPKVPPSMKDRSKIEKWDRGGLKRGKPGSPIV